MVIAIAALRAGQAAIAPSGLLVYLDAAQNSRY